MMFNIRRSRELAKVMNIHFFMWWSGDRSSAGNRSLLAWGIREGRENFCKMFNQGLFFKEQKDCLYVYAQTMNGKRQVGLVGCAGVADYMNGIIKKHELTRADKKRTQKSYPRIKYGCWTVFFAYPDVKELSEIIKEVTLKNASMILYPKTA